MSTKIRLQLSVMMFVQFFVWGAWYVTAPNYLNTIGFTAGDIGWTYTIGPLACIISPFFVGMIADRFFAAQRVTGVLHILGGLLMLLATTLMKASPASPDLINLVLFAHTLCYFPTIALTNTLAMKNVSDSQKDFPSIRVLGTIGWIVSNLVLSWLKWETGIQMFYLTAAAGIVMGLYSFTLPHTPPLATGKVTAREILGLDALVLLKDRTYFIFMLSSFLICIPLAFYYQLASRVVEMTGLEIGQTMSYGQMSEIFFMLVMPFFFARLGVKWMLAVGMLAWVVRYALFALGAPAQVRWMIIGGIVLHGICYDFFFVTGQIFTDQVAPKAIRAQAQGMLVLFTLGLGMAIGAQIAGVVEAQHTTAEATAKAQQMVSKSTELEQLRGKLATATMTENAALQAQINQLEDEQAALKREGLRAIEWQPLWAKPAIFAGLVLLIFLIFFKPRSAPPTGAYVD